MLVVRDLTAGYGGVIAVEDVSINVDQGEIVALIGANGAGKTTLLFAIAGLIAKRSGSVVFNGTDITTASTESIVRRGISLVPETRELFARMSVEENLRAGCLAGRAKGTLAQRFSDVYALFPKLRERLRQRAGTLSGGEQQMLAIGRALMQHSDLLILDEPSLGLSPGLTADVFAKVRDIRATGRTVLLVEQKGRAALEIADRAYVMSVGRVVRSGAASELRRDEAVQRAYFGA